MTSPDPLDTGGANGPVGIILANLTDRQKAFIIKMKPHADSQIISAGDFEAVDPCINLDCDIWPQTYWFGGMRCTWRAGRARRTFQFNDDGLDVRAALSKASPSNGDNP